ncbi:hypothetical protein A499_16983 [Niallia nealsonii AAU1]|nr:hypothetical protein A499_16983 [Niallia nealsonii AAU1]
MYGNWLIDVKVNQNYSFQEMLYTLEKIPGMVSHSLFNKEVTGIIMKYKEKIAYLERKQQDDQI